MNNEKYRFKLRPDMPQGFIKNDSIPELPAMTTYLKLHDGKVFSKEKFQKIINGFQNYLEEKKVPYGIDRVVREGLHITKHEKGKYVIFCYNDGMSGECHFGTLEEIVK